MDDNRISKDDNTFEYDDKEISRDDKGFSIYRVFIKYCVFFQIF